LPKECHEEQPLASVWAAVDHFLPPAAIPGKSKSERKHAIIITTAIDMMQKFTVLAKGGDGKYFGPEAMTPKSFPKTTVYPRRLEKWNQL
jgi:hypothetical protein